MLGAGIRDFSTFAAWEVALRAIFGLGFVDDNQRAIYQRCTHRTVMMALSAVWLALFRFGDKKPYLQRGEVLNIKVIAQDRDAARTIMGYVDGLLSVPLFKQKVKKQTLTAFELAGNVRIEVATCDYRAVRSYTCGAALCDEACFWSNDNGVNPAEAIFAALRPCMKTVPNSLMLIGSSPWACRGAVYDRYDRWFGVPNEHVLIWQAPTLEMNPSIDPAEIQLEYNLDPINAAAEYGAQFRTDVEALLSREVIDAITIPQRFELPYDCDENGSSDSFTLGVAHAKEGTGILDLVREVRPPFSPDAVCSEFSEIMHAYHVNKCSADRYALDGSRRLFRSMELQSNIPRWIALRFTEIFFPWLTLGVSSCSIIHACASSC